MKKKINRKKGFTLVEIIVVLVILAIMAGFAIPAYNGYIDKAKQSEILAEGRALLIAAQTVGQEQYAKTGALKDVDGDALETTIYTDVEKLSGVEGVFTLTYDATGKVTAATFQNKKVTHVATFGNAGWSVAAAPATPLAAPADDFETYIILP